MPEPLSQWLALREAADAEARSPALTDAVAARLRDREQVRVLDLGTGTGSNLRYLLPRLGPNQQWLLVDRDPDVLASVRRRLSEWADSHTYRVVDDANGFTVSARDITCRIETRQMDLGVLDDATIFAGRDLVTASALLDLVSERWLQDLASQCRAHDAVALFALTYDGRSTCSPPEPEDDLIRGLLNQHQKKRGTPSGRAAGPDAAAAALVAFRAAGFHVRQEASDWTISPETRAMQRELLDVWATAAQEIVPARAALVQSWLRRRLEHVEAGRSRITVGHQDLAAWR